MWTSLQVQTQFLIIGKGRLARLSHRGDAVCCARGRTASIQPNYSIDQTITRLDCCSWLACAEADMANTKRLPTAADFASSLTLTVTPRESPQN